LRFDFNRSTNFSSVSNASSKGNVIWAELWLGCTGDAVGAGVGPVLMLAVFVLLMGAFVQLVNKHTAKVRIKTRRIIFKLLVLKFFSE